MIYTYFERDYFNNCGEYPMSLAHFAALLNACFTFSRMFSLSVSNPEHPLLAALENWRVLDEDIAQDKSFAYTACKETNDVLKKFANSVFDFSRYAGNGFPEDLTFYRSDKSIFMDSIAHEGECSIYPRESEDVAEVLSFGRWLPCNDLGQPEIPAKLVQMTLPDGMDIESDPFYQQLIAIRRQPDAYLREKSIDALMQWIDAYWPVSLGQKPPYFPGDVCVLPKWYLVFQMRLLAKYDALTTSTISQALYSEAQTAAQAFDWFFECLDDFKKQF